MKNLIITGILLVFNVFVYQSITAQGLMKGLKDKAQQKIEQRVENRVNEKVDKEMDKQLDKAEESLFKSTEEKDTNAETGRNRSEERFNRMVKNLGITGEPVPVADKYEFSQSIQMHLESFNEKGEKTSEGEFITLLNNDSKSMAYQATSGEMSEKSKGIFIIDAVNKATIILNEEDGKKVGLVFGLDSISNTSKAGTDFSEVEDTPEFYAAHPNVKKTGRTKTITGYKCEEYIITDDDSESEVWITRDLKLNTYDFFSTLFKVETAVTGIGWGYMMESTITENSGEKSFMQVTKIDKNTNMAFSMGDYQITNMGNIKIPAGQ